MTAPTAAIVLEADRLYAPEPISPPAIAVREGRVVALGAAALALGSAVRVAGAITPGLVDIQVNGGYGVDLQAPNPDRARLHRWLAEGGVLTYVPTLYAGSVATMASLVSGLAGELEGVTALAPHLEGPYLSPAMPGSHDAGIIRDSHWEEVAELACGQASYVTLAPERAGADRLQEALLDCGVRVSLGHSQATARQAETAFESGASMVTHIWNQMAPVHHRAPSLPVAALVSPTRPWIGLICDGVHIAHEVAALVFAAAADRTVLVSDSVWKAGLEPESRLSDGRLDGSVARLDACLREAIACGQDPAAALRMTTLNPASALGLQDRGHLQVGARALLAVFDPEFRIIAAGEAEVLAGVTREAAGSRSWRPSS